MRTYRSVDGKTHKVREWRCTHCRRLLAVENIPLEKMQGRIIALMCPKCDKLNELQYEVVSLGAIVRDKSLVTTDQ